MGIKIALLPIFIVSILLLSGFKSTDYSKTDSSLLFDSCLDFIVAKDKAAEEHVSKNNAQLQKNLDDLKIDGSSFAAPDSTNQKKPPVQQDTTGKRSQKVNPDSTAKTKLLVKPDSISKPKIEAGKDSTSKSKTKIPAEAAADKKLNLFPDSLKGKVSKEDSLKAQVRLDSLKRIEEMSKDSTARIEYFRYHRQDSPSVRFDPTKRSSFFVYPSESMLTRQVTLDSTGSNVIIKDMLAGKPYRTYLEMPLSEYIKMRMQTIPHDVLEAKAREYKLKSSKKELGQLITDITNIDIPLPSTPLLSIFGKPNMNLKISGQVNIHGAWRNETTTGVTTSALGNTKNEPDFKQQIQINLNGTIGDKLTLGADWNTERQFQYENQLKIKYTGYEDEIIQSIEAGNVSLETSPLVGGSEALFGVKAKFQLGPFNLTALASQKKSEVKEVSVGGGAQSQTFELHAYDYSPNHFFLDTTYADEKLFNDYFGQPTPKINPTKYVKDIEVWKTYTGIVSPNERKGNAYINLQSRQAGEIYTTFDGVNLRDSTLNDINGQRMINYRWILLQPGIDYDLHPETGFISFRTQIQDQDAIAVAYRVEGPTQSTEDDSYYGEFVKDLQGKTGQDGLPINRLVLRLVKPPGLQPPSQNPVFSTAWKLQLKNIYAVGGRDVTKDGFSVDIKYRQEGSEPTDEINGVKLLNAFGLDVTDESGTSSTPDNKFDFFPGRTVFTATGEIVFPTLQPFGNNFPSDKLDPAYKYQAVYDSTVTFARQDNAKDKFVISGSYSASVTSSYNIGFNVVENSVKVYLNGMQLKEGVDYSVDYNLGQIIIRNDKALVAGADLKISYEQNDLFQLASKTLLGLRGTFDINKETSLGFSFLNLNQQTLSDKVRIGEEPLNNTLYGLDFKTNINLPFVTKALDKVFSTSAPSNFSMSAEYAYINPDPNTKKSTIASDNNQSIAYIDDFEGAKKLIPLGMSYGSWHDISVPDSIPNLAGTEKELFTKKAMAYWYNITPSDVVIKDIYGDRKKAAPDQQQVQTLDLVFDPSKAGYYNNNFGGLTTDISIPTENWGGMMKVLSSTANNLIDENIGFIEFWMHISSAPKDLKLNIDLGQISEDVIPNGKLDTEDKNSNDLVDDGEDTGIDGLFDVNEPGYNPANNPDPNHDDYSYQSGSGDYSHVDGTEGNAVSVDLGKLPDSEDLNRNFTLDRVNSYFRYIVPTDTNKATNPFIQGGGDNKGWYLFRIPLKDFNKAIGNPSFSVVSFIRFWVTGTSSPVHLRFADMNLVGNQWQKVLKPPLVTQDDSVLSISTVSIEDNPEYYSPPGVQRELDKTQPDYQIYKNEQSLDLVIKDLPDGQSREIVKYLTRPLDVFNYKEMKFFIHTENNTLPGSLAHYVDANNYSAEVYLRFGSDSSNYYEYRQPVRYNATTGGWDEVALTFDELTSLKISRPGDSLNIIVSAPVPGHPGNYYSVKGQPTLTRVSYFTIGILNPSNKGTPLEKVSGNIWIDELRVVNADQTPGWAYNGTANLQLADLLRVSGTVSRTNPFFHKLNDSFGSRMDQKSWGVSVDMDVLKMLPVDLPGSNIRLSYSHNEQSSTPLYVPGTDIKISDAQNEKRRVLTQAGKLSPSQIDSVVSDIQNSALTKNVTETWTLSSMRIKVPTEAWYIRDLINNISLGFNYNKTLGQSPTIITSNSWTWNATMNYSVTLSRDLYFKPAEIPIIGSFFDLFSDYRDAKVYFAPQTITASVTANRKRSFSQSRPLNATSDTVALPKPNIQRDFVTTRGAGFSWMLTEGGFWNLALNYNFNISSTLAYLLADSTSEKSEGQIWRSIFGGQLFGRDYNYKQSFDLRTSPKIPSIFDLNRYVSLNAGYSSDYNWQNNFQQGELGKSAGYSSRINASLTIRLKSIFEPLFKESEPKAKVRTAQDGIPPQFRHQAVGETRTGRRTGRRDDVVPVGPEKETEPGKNILHPDTSKIHADSLKNAQPDSTGGISGKLMASLDYLKLFIKTFLLDYDQITVNISQNNSYTGGGLKGDGTGFNNFWGFSQSYDKGPSRLFMLGLSNDIGPRARAGNFTDTYTQNNNIDFSTSKPLWEGAQIKFNWKVGWGINKSVTIQTDSITGAASVLNQLTTGTIDRSFLSLPPSFIFSVFKNGIKKVHELYDPTAADPNANLSQAFLKGFESFSLLQKIPLLGNLSKYIPRPNWSFSWSGLEKYQLFSFAKRITIDHSYTSTYSEGFKVDPSGVNEIQTQKVDYGFDPLAGITFDFDKLFGGSFQGSVKYSSKTSYGLGLSTHNITESYSKDINITASWLKSGFEIPIFGVSLKNDLEISFSYTSGVTSTVLYNMDDWTDSGIPQDGKTTTTMEPKIKYVMSQRVTLSIFYRRTSIEPAGAARIPPTTTNEAGVDVRISIQ